jgi:hypothetical protein
MSITLERRLKKRKFENLWGEVGLDLSVPVLTFLVMAPDNEIEAYR